MKFPYSQKICWLIAFLFMAFAIIQAYFTALYYKVNPALANSILFWTLNYSGWVLMLPIVYHYFEKQLKEKRNILSKFLLGAWIASVHYLIVSTLQWCILKWGFHIEAVGRVEVYLMKYYPTAIFSHLLDLTLIVGLLFLAPFLQYFTSNSFRLVGFKESYSLPIPSQKSEIPNAINFLTLNDKGRTIQLSIKEILWIESKGNYQQLVTQNNSYLYRIPLNRLADLLPASKFIRIHRSFMLQVAAIDHISYTGKNTTYQFEMKNKQCIKSGRAYKKRIDTYFNEHPEFAYLFY